MVTMTAFDALMMEHTHRTEHANRMAWRMQAASKSAKAQRRRRPSITNGAMGIVVVVASLLAALVR